MKFNTHHQLIGKHAIMSASKYHWINYTPERMAESFRTAQAAALGTRLHDFAAEAITLGIKMPRNKKTINSYINDAIGFRMQPEQVLYFSDRCFGTADTISYEPKNQLLRIHDLKTGVIPAHFEQLEVYTALFCLEYGFKIPEIDVELRIYQNDDILMHAPEDDKIMHIMDRIITFDKMIQDIQSEV